MAVYLRLISILFAFCGCGAFYVGMFKNNDYLVAQDRLYKERLPYRTTTAKYGRVFKCPITYLRVVDRLGYGQCPGVQIIRGGLQKKFVVLRLLSYNKPISVNIYVGCANKEKTTTTKVAREAKPAATTKKNEEATEAASDATTVEDSSNQTEPNSEASVTKGTTEASVTSGAEANTDENNANMETTTENAEE